MRIGTLCALGAGLLWGLAFVTPLILPDYPGVMLSLGRYLAFGLIALIPGLIGRKHLLQLSRADWLTAFKLSLVGNLLYYATLANAIQLAGAAVPTLLIGTLPVIIAICANLSSPSAQRLAWRRLLPSLGIIALGLFCVHHHEFTQIQQSSTAPQSLRHYVLGCSLAIIATLAWTWYPIKNSRYLRDHPHINSAAWASAQGISTLPLTLIGFIGYAWFFKTTQNGAALEAFALGPRPALFITLMLLLGLCASWLGTLLWNRASQRLPTPLLAQLIVFETLAALLYAFIFRGQMPQLQVALGIALLIIGVLWGVRTFQKHQD